MTQFVSLIDYAVTTTHSNVRASVRQVDGRSKYIWHVSSLDPRHHSTELTGDNVSRETLFHAAYTLEQFRSAFMRQ